MKVTVTDVSPIRKSMVVEAGPDEVAQERERIVRDFARKAALPGFRPGKAPLSVVRKRFAKELDEELRDRLVARLYGDAVRENDLRPLGEPVVEEFSFEEGQPVRFKTSFEVSPEFTPKKYRGVEVRRPSADRVGDEELDAALESLRQAQATLVPLEGPVADGDFVVADVDGEPEGGEPFRREGMLIEIGGSGNFPEFNQRLAGVAAGATLEFPFTYPEDYEHDRLAGKTVRFRISVREAKRRRVPDLDDGFAVDLGEFDNLDALREKVRGDLLERKRREAEEAVRRGVLDKVLLENPIPLPETLVAAEVRHRLEEVVGMMLQQGMDPRSVQLDWEKLRKRQEDPARKSVHARLVLDAVAEAESIVVDDEEVDERLRREASAIGEPVGKLRQRLEKEHRLEVLKRQIVREKSLDFLVSAGNIQNEV